MKKFAIGLIVTGTALFAAGVFRVFDLSGRHDVYFVWLGIPLILVGVWLTVLTLHQQTRARRDADEAVKKAAGEQPVASSQSLADLVAEASKAIGAMEFSDPEYGPNATITAAKLEEEYPGITGYVRAIVAKSLEMQAATRTFRPPPPNTSRPKPLLDCIRIMSAPRTEEERQKLLKRYGVAAPVSKTTQSAACAPCCAAPVTATTTSRSTARLPETLQTGAPAKPPLTMQQAVSVLCTLYAGWTEEKLAAYFKDVKAGTAPDGIHAMCERYGLIHCTPAVPLVEQFRAWKVQQERAKAQIASCPDTDR